MAEPRPPGDPCNTVTHWLFYAVLIFLPMLGWLSASAFGVTAYVLGVIPLPALVAKDQAFGDAIGSIHGAVALALLALIALHVAGALYHALVKRDGVLQRMSPWPENRPKHAARLG
jgi:cytochrome b561